MSIEELKKLSNDEKFEVIMMLLDTLHSFLDKTNVRIDELEKKTKK